MPYYLNFREDTGKVWKSTNELDESTPYIEIDKETVVEFNTGIKRHSDYIVVPSSKEGETYELKFVHNDVDSYNIEKSIHQIEKNIPIEINSVIIIQDIINGIWKIKLTDQLFKTLNSTSYYRGKNHDLYVTYKDDPNILLDTLRIDFSNVLENGEYVIENTNKKVAQNTRVSIYCGKVFENYIHVVEN